MEENKTGNPEEENKKLRSELQKLKEECYCLTKNNNRLDGKCSELKEEKKKLLGIIENLSKGILDIKN